MSTGTPWAAGRLDAKSGAKKILFGRMYEDAAIEDAAFAAPGRVFCIASAGCMAMQLATRHRVTAVDINPVQLAYATHRAAGGTITAGAAERIMNIGRSLTPLLGWRRRLVETFLDLEQPDEQIAFWNRHLDTARFRIGTDLLFSLAWLRLVYAAPFLEVLPPRFGRVVRARLARCWKTHPNRTNPHARALLLGSAPDIRLPQGAEPIHFVCADAAAFLESCAPGSFDGFTLSNVLDGASAGYRERLLRAVRHAGTPESVSVMRSFAEPTHASATNHAAQDRSILWGIVEVGLVNASGARTR
jgi:hypothetical protein